MLEADLATLEPAEGEDDEAAAARAEEEEDHEAKLGTVSAKILACPGGRALVEVARGVLGRRKGEASAVKKVNNMVATMEEAYREGQGWHIDQCMGDEGPVASKGCAILMMPAELVKLFADSHECLSEAQKVKGHLSDETSELLVSEGADSDSIAILWGCCFPSAFDSASICFRFDALPIRVAVDLDLIRIRFASDSIPCGFDLRRQ